MNINMFISNGNCVAAVFWIVHSLFILPAALHAFSPRCHAAVIGLSPHSTVRKEELKKKKNKKKSTPISFTSKHLQRKANLIRQNIKTCKCIHLRYHCKCRRVRVLPIGRHKYDKKNLNQIRHPNCCTSRRARSRIIKFNKNGKWTRNDEFGTTLAGSSFVIRTWLIAFGSATALLDHHTPHSCNFCSILSCVRSIASRLRCDSICCWLECCCKYLK